MATMALRRWPIQRDDHNMGQLMEKIENGHDDKGDQNMVKMVTKTKHQV